MITYLIGQSQQPWTPFYDPILLLYKILVLFIDKAAIFWKKAVYAVRHVYRKMKKRVFQFFYPNLGHKSSQKETGDIFVYVRLL